MSDRQLPTHSNLAEMVADVVRERDALQVQIDAYRNREQDIARRMYRRGYLAGRSAQRRGSPAVTNPERHARGELRRLLNAG